MQKGISLPGKWLEREGKFPIPYDDEAKAFARKNEWSDLLNEPLPEKMVFLGERRERPAAVEWLKQMDNRQRL